MAFPQAAATNTSQETAATTTHTVNLPAGIVAGDFLVLFLAFDGNPVHPPAGLPGATLPVGWTSFSTSDAGSNLTLQIATRVADGTEGATISVTTDISVRSAHQSYRINSSAVSGDVSVALATGTSAAANPPSETPIWGADDTLWLICAVSDADTTFSADPTNYTNPLENNSTGTTSGVKVRTLRRELNAASEDPGAFTNTNRVWAAATVAVRPVVPSGYVRRGFRGGP